MTRSPDDWTELYRRLKGIADDPQEERDRRVRALAIIETIPREYRKSAQKPEWSTGYEPDFEGII